MQTPPAWVLQKPLPETQYRTPSGQRGINPCLTPDPGFGAFYGWDRAPSIGQMLVPKGLHLDRSGRFDVVVHFHGHEPARKEWVSTVDSVVMVGIDLGNGSGAYLNKFAHPNEFRRLLESVEQGVAKRLGVPQAKVGRVAVTSWSAGYGATLRILSSEYGRRMVDAVFLLDGLHTGYTEQGIEQAKLQPVVDFARAAAKNEKLLFVSHSSITPPDYVSTTETAQYLVWSAGGRPQAGSQRESYRMGLHEVQRFTKAGLHVRGFAGNGRLDHCAQFAMLSYATRNYLAPRWGFKPLRN